MLDIISRYYDEDIIKNRVIDICHNDNVSKKTALIYLHGGSWRGGHRESYHLHFQHFAPKGYLCASIGYRFVPVRAFDQIGDVIHGYDTLVTYVKEKGIEIDNYIIIGGSAGSHLASMIALLPPDYFNKDIRLKNKWIKPQGCVSINGPGTLEKWDNMDKDLWSCIQRFADAKYQDDTNIFKELSPITHVTKDTIPFLFLLAGIEQFFPHETVRPFYNKIKDFGIYTRLEIFEGSRHGFLYDTSTRNSEKALVIMEDFIDKVKT